MPANVPTRAAPMKPPRSFGDWSSAPMALMTPSTAATMPSAGSASATTTERVVGHQLALHDGVDFLVHQRLDLVRAGVAHDDEAHVVADELQQRRIREHARERLEDFRRRRVVDMRLDLVAALAAQLAHQGMERTEQIEIVALTRHRAGHGLDCRKPGVHDDLPGIGHEEGAAPRCPG